MMASTLSPFNRRNHALMPSYSARQNFLETLIAQRPRAGTGMQLRFSTRFSPDMIRTAYAPVQVKALTIGISSIKKIPCNDWKSR